MIYFFVGLVLGVGLTLALLKRFPKLLDAFNKLTSPVQQPQQPVVNAKPIKKLETYEPIDITRTI